MSAYPGTIGHWNPAREEWWTSVSSSYENITTVGDALTSCWSLLESSWSIRSEGYRFLSDYKLRHALSSCKTFLNLSIMKELQDNRNEAQYWFYINIATSALSAILFVFTTYMFARLRRSTRLRQKMKKFLPASWFEKKRTPWYKMSPRKKMSTPLPNKQLQPWHHSGHD